jgi:hypothetical protein
MIHADGRAAGGRSGLSHRASLRVARSVGMYVEPPTPPLLHVTEQPADSCGGGSVGYRQSRLC